MSDQAKRWCYVGISLGAILLGFAAEYFETNIFVVSFCIGAIVFIYAADKFSEQEKKISDLKEKVKVLEVTREWSNKTEDEKTPS